MRRKHSLLTFIEYLTTLSYSNLFGLLVGMILVFGGLFWLLSTFDPQNGLTTLATEQPLKRLLDALYFSVVTSTSVGYGDIVPIGWARILAGLECIVGFFGAGIFIAKITSARNDAALNEIHRQSFDNLSRQIREELFILRRDFDVIVEEAHRGTVSDKSWQNLRTACYVAQMRIEDIPRLYGEHDLYTIDDKREGLLLDGVARTLVRMDELLIVLKKDGNLTKHKAEIREMEIFLKALNDLLPEWKKSSPHKNGAFKEIEKYTSKLHKDFAMKGKR